MNLHFSSKPNQYRDYNVYIKFFIMNSNLFEFKAQQKYQIWESADFCVPDERTDEQTLAEIFPHSVKKVALRAD